MPSRRIGSKSNLSPQQELTINPFNSFDSDNINKLTRIISNGSDGIVFGLDLNTNRRIPDSVFEKTTVKSGMFYNSDNWVLTDKCEPELIGDNLKGFNITCVDDICTQEIKYILDSSMLPLNYIGLELKFNFKFKIDSGSPYKVIATVLDSEYAIQYPRHNGSVVTLSVIHRIEREGNIHLRLTFILNPEDINAGAYGEYVPKPEVYEGQSDVRISDIEYSYEVISQAKKSSIYKNIYDRYDGNYPMSYIHPSNIIYVTPGLAIKDDVVLQENGLDAKFLTPAMKLEVGNDKSWIKGGAFKPEDFYQEDASQSAFILNQNPPGKLLSGSIVGNDLSFYLDTEKYVSTIDDYELNNLDYIVPENKISFSETDNKYLLTINDFNIEQDIDLYGSVLYIVHKEFNKILKQIEIIPDRTDETKLRYHLNKVIYINKSDLPIVFNNTNIKDLVKIVVSCGPIKVSGSPVEYNSNMVKWANVVIYYSYFKHPEPNKSYIGLLRDEDLNDPIFNEDYLVLGRVRFISPTKIDLISYENRQNIYYFRELAKHIEYASQLDPIDEQVWTDPETGLIDVPEDISSAITKLADLIKKYKDSIPDPSSYEDDVVYNTKDYLEEDKLIEWVPDEDNPEKGHLRSNISLDKPESSGGSGLSDRTNAIPTSALIGDLMGSKADLDESGHVPSSQLPSYVDDVLEFPTKDDFPDEGEDGKIYVDKDTNLTYRWSGTDYIEISPSLALGETSSTAFPGNRGKKLEENVDDHTQQIEDLQGRIFTPPNGKDGQFIKKIDGTTGQMEFDWIMNNGILNSPEKYNTNYNCYVVDNSEDLDLCKKTLSFRNDGDLESFSHFAHTNNVNDGWTPETTDEDLDYIKWQYGVDPLSENHTSTGQRWIEENFLNSFPGNKYFCLSNINLYEHAGYISKEKYSNYDICVRFYATKTLIIRGQRVENDWLDDTPSKHNDSFGFVAAFTTDSKGKQHTLTFVRSGGILDGRDESTSRIGSYWTLELDKDTIYRIPEVGNFRNSTAVLCDNSNNVLHDNPFLRWRECGDGVLVHVKREGNIFTAWTSERVENGIYNRSNPDDGDIKLEEKTKIVLDLNNFTIQTYDGTSIYTTQITNEKALRLLKMFKCDSSWGFSKCGFLNVAQVEFIDCPGSSMENDYIIDRSTNKVWIHDFYGWQESDENYLDILGSGKFSYNSITKKLFWNDGTNIVQIDPTEIPNGLPGQVLYKKDNQKLEFHEILHDNVYVCETTEEAEKCKNRKIDFNYLSKKWIRIGHIATNGKYYQYGIDPDYPSTNSGVTGWKYDPTIGKFVQKLNSSDWNGFVCNNKSKYIDMTVRCISNNADDDYNGVVLMVYGPDGRQHIIHITRALYVANPPSLTESEADIAKQYKVTEVVNSNVYKIAAVSSSSQQRTMSQPPDPCNTFFISLDCASIKTDYRNELVLEKGPFSNNTDNTIATQTNTNRAIDYVYKYNNKTGTPCFYNPIEEKYCVPQASKCWFQVKTTTVGSTLLLNSNKCIGGSYNGAKFTSSTNPTSYSDFNKCAWAGFKGGVVLNVEYKQILDSSGDVVNAIITCKTTKFLDSIEDPIVYSDKQLVLDINKAIEDYPAKADILNLFKHKSGVHYGLINMSQSESYFDIIDIRTDDYPGIVVDKESNSTFKYINGLWDKISDYKEYLKPGSEYYNPILNQLYWCDLQRNITPIVSKTTDSALLDLIYPVGSIYISANIGETAPFGGTFGTWVKVSEGRCLCGSDSTHNPGTEIAAGLPKPKITAKSKWRYVSGGGGAEYTIHGGTGESGAGTMKDNNVIQTTATVDDDEFYGKSTTVQPPAFAVNIWKRTA